MHIGYTAWHDEPADKLPGVVTLPAGAPAAPGAAPLAAPTAAAYTSLDAEHYTQAVATGPITWQRLPDLGRTAGAVTNFPVTAAPTATPGGSSPHLAYRISLAEAGPVTVRAYLAPILDFTNTTGLRYAVSLDDEAPQIVNLHTGLVPDNGNRPWEQAVAENIVIKTSQHGVAAAGSHVLRLWRVDAGVVLEKLVVSQGAVPASYLGPPENVAPPATKGNLGSR
ncbi:hypothetical protein [Hymenobacter sp. PAMC 26628]|uniref:hypothetical protein n=1 Tax=Hymenobacter sp. PAMC 26628 TaxID=1484118 RepID=UPI001F38C2A4|nr:hypothetical protein [Hymenobacter sp. PAMC 26628]